MEKLKVFLSWSGRRSKDCALAFREWLPNVLQNVDPWCSEVDIDKGTRWNDEIAVQLSGSQVGIVFLTPENLTSPWLLFEAGAVAKHTSESYVCTFLLDLQPGGVTYPLATFQTTDGSSKGDVQRLVDSINKRLGDRGLTPDRFATVFEKWWPDLLEKLDIAKGDGNPEKTALKRDVSDILEELVVTVRALDRKVSQLEVRNAPAPASGSPNALLEAMMEVRGHSPTVINSYETLTADQAARVKKLLEGLSRKSKDGVTAVPIPSDSDPKWE